MSSTDAHVVPRTLIVSLLAWIASAVVLVVIAIVNGTRPVDAASFPSSQYALTTIAPVSAAIGDAVAAAVVVAFAVLAFRRHGWAWVVVTVVGGIVIVVLVLNAFGGDLLAALGAVLTAVALVLMYLPPSRRYLHAAG